MFESICPELIKLGLSPFFMQQLHALEGEGHLGRVACERRGQYEVLTRAGLLRASLSGRLEHRLAEDDRPTVGDWVVVEPAEPVGRVVAVLERQSVLRRSVVDGTSRAQNLAANVDLCCVVAALSGGDEHTRRRALNPRRIERYLMTAQGSNVPALVLVNKADVVSVEEAEEALRALDSLQARLLLVSAHTGQGLDELRAELPVGTSAVLLGSSGVGKSTLVNALLGEQRQRTSAERTDDSRGRHTTTERQLLELESGALLIDTPGMRELSLWADADSEVGGFEDIERLAETCQFRDCSHRTEPGCAVVAAIQAGTLAAERLEHAHKLEKERLFQQARVDVRLRTELAARSKALSRAVRVQLKNKGRR
ncbi:MAG: ribosome small subunit-dependent GTPase A [Myxococcales bacterium]|nr:MAG: ribosome small subunit-dependent GTPase A [Myxococcales bacterium]